MSHRSKVPFFASAVARGPLPDETLLKAIGYFTETPMEELPGKASLYGTLLYAEVHRLRNLQRGIKTPERSHAAKKHVSKSAPHEN